jgi:hypothetical protein
VVANEGILKPWDTLFTVRACDRILGACNARDLSRAACVMGFRMDDDIERDCLTLRDTIHET